MSTLSDNLQNLRLMRGYSLKYVSEKIGCAPNTIANWEKGKTQPSADALILITKVYNVKPEQLFGWEEIEELQNFLNTKKTVMDEMKKLQEQKAEIDKKLREYAKVLNQDQKTGT